MKTKKHKHFGFAYGKKKNAKRKEVHNMKKKILALTLALTIPASALAAFANSDETVNYDDLVVTLPATEADGGPVYDGGDPNLTAALTSLEKDSIPVAADENQIGENGIMLISENGEEGVPYKAESVTLSKIVFGTNGAEIKGAPVVKDGVVMLPLRELAEADGLTVEWEEDTNTAVLNSGMFSVTLGENKYIKGRMKALELDCAPVLIDDKTYVPASFFTDVLDKYIEVKNGELHITDMITKGEAETNNTVEAGKSDEKVTIAVGKSDKQ